MPITLLGLPYDASSSFQRGAAAAPGVIRRALASESSNLWTEALVDLGAPGVLADGGDVELGGGEDGAAARAAVEAGVAAVLAGGARPLALGGDHSVTLPALRAVRKRHPRGLAVVQFDAHPDLYDAFEGDRHSHASQMARAMEEGLADRLVQVGIRTMSGHQRAQADRFGVEVVDVRTWSGGGAALAERLAFDVPVYVTFDVDALDPAFAPGISHREPGGLTVRQALDALHAIRAPAIVAADVVEFNPSNDLGGVTAMVCAKVVKELAGRMVEGRE